MNPAGHHVQAAFCQVLVDEWARAGVTDAVIAPGSRSTPLVVALDQDDRLRVHVVLDERSAGFMCLGLGLATGRPAVAVTTSGTASVELHPSVVEASQACVPMLAVTTDRPPELHHVGAPQTVEQDALFGAAPRWTCQPGVPDWSAAAGWRSVASRAAAEAAGSAGPPGPVHLNLAFREPLIGSAASVEAPPGRAGGEPWHAADRSAPGEVGPLPSLDSPRGLVVAGEGAGGPALVEAAARLGWPVLADPRSGCRLAAPHVVAAADALLRVKEVASWTPDVVVRAGGLWASKVLAQWLAALPAEVPQILVDRWARWADPDRRAAVVVAAEPASLLAAQPVRVDPAWAAQWGRAERGAQEVFDDLLAAGRPLDLTEPAIARTVASGLPDGSQLFVSSSMPVRDVEWYSAPRTRLRVLSNRGANGIDGVLSTALGAALATGGPTAALVGDLAFLHDAGALLWARGRDVRLTVIVVDNDGGGIFSFLPQAELLPPATFERYWGTPHGVSIATVAAAYGTDVRELTGRSELDDLIARAAEPGLRIGVVATDRSANVEAHEALHVAVSARLEQD